MSERRRANFDPRDRLPGERVTYCERCPAMLDPSEDDGGLCPNCTEEAENRAR